MPAPPTRRSGPADAPLRPRRRAAPAPPTRRSSPACTYLLLTSNLLLASFLLTKGGLTKEINRNLLEAIVNLMPPNPQPDAPMIGMPLHPSAVGKRRSAADAADAGGAGGAAAGDEVEDGVEEGEAVLEKEVLANAARQKHVEEALADAKVWDHRVRQLGTEDAALKQMRSFGAEGMRRRVLVFASMRPEKQLRPLEAKGAEGRKVARKKSLDELIAGSKLSDSFTPPKGSLLERVAATHTVMTASVAKQMADPSSKLRQQLAAAGIGPTAAAEEPTLHPDLCKGMWEEIDKPQQPPSHSTTAPPAGFEPLLVSPAQLLREAELRAAVECSKVTKAEMVAELQSAYFQRARVALEEIDINLRNYYAPEADHSLTQCTGHKMKSACLRA